MSIGRSVRTRLGRYEVPVSRFYRERFIDLEACSRTLASIAQANSILEVGCGDGQLADTLVESFPEATYTGIDVAADVGRLYRGDPARASFKSIDSESFLASSDERYDLVLLVDVLHHVPRPARPALINDVRTLTAEGGRYAVKDWVRSRGPAHLAAWASDRLLTGDRVAYFDGDELDGLVPGLFPDDRRVLRSTVPPRRNNVLLVYEPART